MQWAAPAPAAWRGLPASVTCTGATAAGGRRLRFLHNWSWTPAAVAAPVDCRDVLSGKPVPAGGQVELGAWDVRVLVEE
ncbi:MAG TPA: Beta-galactosidase C-terminal domain [Dactylosporangium sp.]|jgi:beta-galactosidase|nr:Beta-galactosidase C-terminal domain [Dactylosporangium sp.]